MTMPFRGTKSDDASTAAPTRSRSLRLAQQAVRDIANPWRRYAVVTAVFTGLAVVATWPFTRLVSHAVLGDSSDVPLGARLFWALDHEGGNPFTTARDYLLSAPEGVEVLRAANLANFLFTAPVWALGHAIGFVEAFNVYAFAALVLSGTAAFVVLDQLKLGTLAASFGAYVFAFNPNHIDKVFGHAPLAATGILPLVLLALIAERRRRTVARAVVAGLLLAVAFYLNSYLGLFAAVLAAVFAVVDYRLRPAETSRFVVVRSYYCLALAFLLGLIPLGASWYFDPSSVSSLSAARSEVFPGGSAAPQLYLLPGPRHPLLGGPMTEWLETNLSWEYTMFFGYTTMALAVAGAVLALLRHQRGSLGQEARFIVVFGIALTIFGMWASLPPKVRVGEFVPLLLYTMLVAATVAVVAPFLLRRSARLDVPTVVVLASAVVATTLWIMLPTPIRTGDFEFPTPSYFIREATTLYRVFSRFGVLVGLGLVLLAAYALASLPLRRYRIAVGSVALVLVAFELYAGPPKVIGVQDVQTPVTVREIARSASSRPVIMDVSDRPRYLDWLRVQPRGYVADYPNPFAPDSRWAWKDVFYQQYHQQPLWQTYGAAAGTSSAFREYATDLTQPLTPVALEVAQVKYVVVHRDRYEALRLRQPVSHCGLEYLAGFPEDEVAVYGVTRSPERPFALRDKGFYAVENRQAWPESKGFRWMSQTGHVLLYSPRDDEVFLSGVAVSPEGSRELDVFTPSGEQVGAWEILTFETYFRFALPVRKGFNRFVLYAKPNPKRDRDPRKRPLAMTSMNVMPIPEARSSAAPAAPPTDSADRACVAND